MTSADPNNAADLPLIERLAAIPYTGRSLTFLTKWGTTIRLFPILSSPWFLGRPWQDGRSHPWVNPRKSRIQILSFHPF